MLWEAFRASRASPKSSFLVTKRDKPSQAPTVRISLFAEICAPITSDPAAAEIALIWSGVRGAAGRSPSGFHTHPHTTASMDHQCCQGADFAIQPGRNWGFPAAGVLGGGYQAQRQLAGIFLPSPPSVPSVFCACSRHGVLLSLCCP